MSHYQNHSVVIQDNADSTPRIIGSLSQVDTPIDNQVEFSETAGSPFAENLSVVAQKPKATFTTFDIPKIWAALGLAGRTIVEGAGKPGFAVVQALYNDSTVSAGSTHRRLRFPKSYGMISRLSVGHQKDATADAELRALYDGTNNPIVIEGNQALPVLPANPGRWTLASISVGGVELVCNINIDITFGVNAETFGCDSELWDSHLQLTTIQPKISITSLHPQNLAASIVPLAGLHGLHTDTEFVLRKRLDGQAGFVPDATAQHIKITADGILLVTNAHNATGNQRAQQSLEMSLRHDGTNAPLVMDTAYAIA